MVELMSKKYKPFIEKLFERSGVPTVFQSATGFGDASVPHSVFPFGDNCFIDPEDDIYTTWGGEEIAQALRAQVLIFMMGGDQFLYGLWSHDGRPLLDSPVVYLDDEGSGNQVIAQDLNEFLALACWGFDRLNEVTVSEDLDDGFEAEEEEFFVKRKIKPLANPLSNMAAARAAHPDFDAWLDSLR